MRVEELMTRSVRVCRADENLDRAAKLMWEHDCGFVPVVSTDGDGAVVGVVTDRDIAMAAYTQGKPPWAIPVTIAMAKKVIACKVGDEIPRAEALMSANQVRRLPVLDPEGRLVGILSLDDIAGEAQREARRGGRPEVSAEGLAETLAAICRPRTKAETIAPA
jgi:CBS domain-containing protein